MRMVPFPVGLPITALTPQGGPLVLGSTTSGTRKTQVVVDPTGGLWSFTLEVAKMKGPMARAFSQLSVALHGGANCCRVPFFDPDEPSFREMGINVSDNYDQQYVSWSNGEFWSNGKPWRIGKPLATIAAASAKNSGTITIDTTAWGGVLPTFFGIVGHFAVYCVTGSTFSGNVATCRVFPPVRRAITTTDYATLRPVMAAQLTGPSGAPWSRDASAMSGAQLDIIEVPDEVVLNYVTEDYP